MATPNSIPSTLADALLQRCSELFDACALLDAAEERIDSATPSTSDDEEGHEKMHNTLRIVQMARDRVKAAADGLFELSDLRA